jgi:hypothetical protein
MRVLQRGNPIQTADEYQGLFAQVAWYLHRVSPGLLAV